MNLAMVNQIAKAVLYEGYMLYPYRPSSVKNQQRWNFGVLFPKSYSTAQNGEAWTMQTECLIEGSSLTGLEVRVRFLQLVARSVGELISPVEQRLPGESPRIRPVQRLAVNGRVYQPWQEAIERELILPVRNVEMLQSRPFSNDFAFTADRQIEYLRDDGGLIAGAIVRERRPICGAIEITCNRVDDGVFKVGVRILNTTPFSGGAPEASREDALLSSLASTHTVLGVQDGSFVSLLAPGDQFSGLAADCKNVGTWPVLVGEEGQNDTVLSSPIILYDYPQIAPESAGDLFDGTEIDEILSLRILTLTDDEKREMSQSDERARQMLERTETMPAEQFMKLHGVLRGLRPLKEESQ